MAAGGRHRRWIPYLAAVIGPLLIFGPALIQGKVLFWGTPLLQFIPWRSFIKEAVLQGQLPLWNPLLGFGAPLVANYQTAFFYPPHLLLLVLPIAWGQTLLITFHLIWAGWGMARLSEHLEMGWLAQSVATLAFSMSGYLLARGGFLSIITTAAWLPWIILAVETSLESLSASSVNLRRNLPPFLALTSVFALQWLAGHAQTAWYTLVLAICWFIWKAWGLRSWRKRIRAALLISGTLVLAFALAAVQLIPTAEYLFHSNRAGSLDPEFVMNYSMWPWRLMGFLAPDLFGNPAQGNFWGYGNYWEDAVYIGVLPFIMMIMSLLRRQGRGFSIRWFLFGVGCISLLLALGRNTPVFPTLFRYAPTFNLFQAPTRWNLLTVFAFSLLAGYGVESWGVLRGWSLYWVRLGTAGSLAIMVSAAGATLLLRGLEPTFVPAIAGSGFWLLLTGILALRRKEVPSPAWKIAVLGVVLVDLFVAGYDLNPTRRLEEEGNDRGVLEQISEAHRIYYPSQVEQKVKFDIAFRFDTFEPQIPWESIRETGLPNISMLENIPAADNFDPILTDRYSFFIDQLEGAPVETQRAVYPWLNVGWIADLPAAPHPDHPVAFLPVEAPVQVWFVDGVERVDDYDRAIRRALNGVEWGSLAILEADSLGPSRMQTAPSGSAHIVERDITGDTVVAVQLQRGGWLVLADSYYLGWTVKVDGEKRQVYPANGILRAVWVEPGEQRVEFSYQPFSFRAGVVTSLLALLLILVGWIQCRR